MSETRRRLGHAARLLKRARAELDFHGPRGAAAEHSLVWMLGSPRTGSTWLLNLLGVSKRVVPFDEPGIGYHLGLFVTDVMGTPPRSFEDAHALLPAGRSDDDQYFFSKRYEHVWSPRLRGMILDRIHEQLSEEAQKRGIDAPIAIIKEPTGSQVAEFVFELLPRSRLLFLVRDPRDVMDSILDSLTPGSWLASQFGVEGELSSRERLDILVGQAHRWLTRTEVVQRVYDRLPQVQRHLVRYEDLRANTATTLRGVLRWLDLAVPEDRLRETVERLSFEALPESATGKGKFTRAAEPGKWREDLTPEEQAVLDEILGESLARYGYEVIAKR